MSVKPRAFHEQCPLRWHSIINSPVGHLYVVASDSALTGIWYENQAHFPHLHELGARIANPTGLVAEADERTQTRGTAAEYSDEHIYVAPARIIAQTERELGEYFRGLRTDFEVPLDPEGTDFQLAVWECLKTVPYGYTVTYGEISRMVGPGAPAQAVGQAVGRNKISIIIPCHRVLGAGGKLTGYAGGLDRKRWLLNREEPQDIRNERLF